MRSFLKIDGQQLEAQWIEESLKRPDAPVLVFLHEGLGCIDLWKDFPSLLCRETQLPGFMYSRAGYGHSDPCPLPRKKTYLHKEARTLLPQVLSAARIRDHIIMGHSDGGSIGIIFAGSPHAAHLKGLITEAAHVCCEPVTTAFLKEARKAYLETNLKQKLERYHGTNTDTAFWGWNRTWLDPRFDQWNIEKYLKKITVPFLAVQGRQDPTATLAQLSSMAENAPNGRMKIIEDCGHIPHLEKKQEVVTVMGAFIAGIVGQ